MFGGAKTSYCVYEKNTHAGKGPRRESGEGLLQQQATRRTGIALGMDDAKGGFASPAFPQDHALPPPKTLPISPSLESFIHPRSDSEILSANIT